MPYCLQDKDIENFIEEDVPYVDLTSSLLGIGNRQGEIIFQTRENIRVCCTEEASRVFEKCGAMVARIVPSGSDLPAGSEILTAKGPGS